jgi:hypothetical protein
MSWWTRNKGGAADGGSADMPLIRLEHITKIFKGDDVEEETHALWDVSVDAENPRSSRFSRCSTRRRAGGTS